MSGVKRWTIYEPGFPGTLNSAALPEQNLVSAVQQPGDSVYIPQGYTHVVATEEIVSIHVTIGILNVQWLEVFHAMLKRAAGEINLLSRSRSDSPPPVLKMRSWRTSHTVSPQ